MRRGLGWALPLAAASWLGCFNGPTAGEVTLSLATPRADDGAVSFVVTAAAPNELTGATAACDGCDVFYTRVSATEIRGVVTGDLTAGPVVRLSVSTAAPNQAYEAEVLEVCSRQFAARAVTGYTLTIQ